MNRLGRSLTLGRRRVSKLRILLAEPRYRRALRHRVAASVEHERTPLRHDYRTILDVGANRGQFALVAAHRFPRAAMVCFEPQAVPRGILARVLAGHPRLRVLDVALAAEAGTSIFHITQADDSSSLLPTTDLQIETFPNTEVVRQMRVETQRLDDLVLPDDLVRPVLLKVDVQGTELDVLAGSSGVLPLVDTILVECSFVELYSGQALANEVYSFLHGNGFCIANIMAPAVDDDGRVLQADMVYERCDSTGSHGTPHETGAS